MKTMDYIDEYHVKERTKGCWIEICYANIMVVLCLVLAFFLSPLSLALVVLAYIYLEAGLHAFVMKLMRKEAAGYEELFFSPKLFLKAFALKLVYVASILLWNFALIVPGVIVALNYAFVLPVFADNSELDIRKILERSKTLVLGYRYKILLVFLCALVIACAGGAIGFGITALIGLATTVPVWAMSILIVFFAGLAIMFVSLPLYESFLISCYMESLERENNEKNKKSASKPTKKVVNKN